MSPPFVIDRETRERREMNAAELAQLQTDNAARAAKPTCHRIVGYQEETVDGRDFKWPVFSAIEEDLTAAQITGLEGLGYDVTEI